MKTAFQIFIIIFLPSSLVAQGWELKSVHNDFDGEYKISYISSYYSSSKLWDEARLHVRNHPTNGIEFFLSGIGYTGGSNHIRICFDGERYYNTKGHRGEGNKSVFIKPGEGITESQLIYELVNSKRLSIRHEHSIDYKITGIDKKDYSFNLQNNREDLISTLGENFIDSLVLTSTNINYDSLDLDKIQYSLSIKNHYSKYQKYPAYIELTANDSIHIVKEVVFMMNKFNEFIEHNMGSNPTDAFNNTGISITLELIAASVDSPNDLLFYISYNYRKNKEMYDSHAGRIEIKKERVYVANTRESKKYIEENNKNLLSVFSNTVYNDTKVLPRILGVAGGLGLGLLMLAI